MVEADRDTSAFFLEISQCLKPTSAVSPCLERSHVQVQHRWHRGISCLLCSDCCPPSTPLDPSTLEFIRLHLCFALAAKHLPREEEVAREGRRESYCYSYLTARFVAFQGNLLVLGCLCCPGHREALGQSLICSPVNTEGLSCGKQVRKFSCFYQR